MLPLIAAITCLSARFVFQLHKAGNGPVKRQTFMQLPHLPKHIGGNSQGPPI